MDEWYRPISDRLSDKFKTLLNIQYSSEKDLLSKWIRKFQVKDGKKKTIRQFQETFHSTFWEIYINEVVLRSGDLILNETASPDFCIKHGDSIIGVEAVIANIADSEAKETERTLYDVYGENNYHEIMHESIIRSYNAFSSKEKLYQEKYKNIPSIKDEIFTIAIGDYGQINYGQTNYKAMLALLYQAYHDPDDQKEDLIILCEDTTGREYKHLEKITKKKGGELNIGIFSNSNYSHISAVIYSCTLSLGKLSSLSECHSPLGKCIMTEWEIGEKELRILRYSGSSPDENLFDGLFVFHNPYAEKKLPPTFLRKEGIVHFTFNTGESFIETSPEHPKILKRRYVCMKGMEADLIPDFDDLAFLPVPRND